MGKQYVNTKHSRDNADAPLDSTTNQAAEPAIKDADIIRRLKATTKTAPGRSIFFGAFAYYGVMFLFVLLFAKCCVLHFLLHSVTTTGTLLLGMAQDELPATHILLPPRCLSTLGYSSLLSRRLFRFIWQSFVPWRSR